MRDKLKFSLVFSSSENSNLRAHLHDFFPVRSVNFGHSLLFTVLQVVGVTIYSNSYGMDPSSETNKCD